MLTYQIATGLDSLPAARAIRQAVFIKEQGFQHEFDEIDRTAVEALVLEDDRPVATGRTFPESDGWTIGRVAVRRECRGKGLGAAVVHALEAEAAKRGAKRIALHAQVRVRGFYESLGYHAEGPEFLEECCPHIRMTKEVSHGSTDRAPSARA